jgi:hypothetical protein
MGRLNYRARHARQAELDFIVGALLAGGRNDDRVHFLLG